MSKERLEEFKDYIDFLDDSNDMEDHERFIDTLLSLYDDGWFYWVHRYTKEQAELLQQISNKNVELNEFLNDYSEGNHWGKNIIDVAMDIITKQSERMQELEKENIRLKQDLGVNNGKD